MYAADRLTLSNKSIHAKHCCRSNQSTAVSEIDTGKNRFDRTNTAADLCSQQSTNGSIGWVHNIGIEYGKVLRFVGMCVCVCVQ